MIFQNLTKSCKRGHFSALNKPSKLFDPNEVFFPTLSNQSLKLSSLSFAPDRKDATPLEFRSLNRNTHAGNTKSGCVISKPSMSGSTPQQEEIRALIIGGGVAGTTCAATLATHHPTISITLIDPAPGIRIAKAISRITPTAHDVSTATETSESWCEKRGIRFLRSVATRLTRNTVHLADGRVHGFDVCCLATGARPVLPVGLKDNRFWDMVYVLRDTDSVDRLKQKLRGVKRVMVVGAGGIAMEVVYELVDCDVFWVVKRHIGGSFFDGRLGALIAGVPDIVAGREGISAYDERNENENGGMGSSMAGSGVGPDWLGARDGPMLFGDNGEVKNDTDDGRLHGGGGRKEVKVINAEVSRLAMDPKRSDGVEAHLSNGTKVCCDMIIVGAGVKPNTEWVASSGVAVDGVDGGIITKCGCMETSVPNIYAAGDCTRMIRGGENWSQMRVWSQAFVAGRAAGLEMGRTVGGEGYSGLEFEVFAHATKFFGRRVVLLGRFDGADRGKMHERFDDEEIVRVVVVDGRVRGAVLVGDVDCGEVLENLIISGLDVSFLGERIVEKEIELEEYFD